MVHEAIDVALLAQGMRALVDAEVTIVPGAALSYYDHELRTSLRPGVRMRGRGLEPTGAAVKGFSPHMVTELLLLPIGSDAIGSGAHDLRYE